MDTRIPTTPTSAPAMNADWNPFVSAIAGAVPVFRSLVVADVAKQEIVKSIRLGLTKIDKPSIAGVFPHPDNRHAFETVRNDNSMLVLDLVSGETLGRVEVQSSPDGVTYSRVQR